MRFKDPLYNRTFFLAFGANFFVAMHFTNNAIFPLWVTESGEGAKIVGWFMAVYSIAAIAGRPLIGWMIDKYGSRRVWMMGILLMGVSTLGYIPFPVFSNSPIVWTFRFLQGLGAGAHFTAFFTVAGGSAPEGRRNESIGKFGLSGISALFIAPAMGEYVTRTYGFVPFFILLSIFSFIGFFLIMGIREKKVRNARSPRAALAVLKAKGTPLAIAMALVASVCFMGPSAYLGPLAESRGISNFALYFTAFSVTGFIVRVTASHWGDKFGLRRILIPSFLIYALAHFTIALSVSTIWILVSGLLAGVAHGFMFPAVTALGFTLTSKENTGSAIALITGSMDAGAGIAAYALGQAAAGFGYGVVFPLSLTAPLIGAGILSVSVLRNRAKLTRTRTHLS